MNRTIEDIAGYMSERYVWQMLYEVSAELVKIHSKGIVHQYVTPSSILWDELHFYLADISNENNKSADAYKFDAPELACNQPCIASDIWSIGATAFYMHLGCHVLNGRGGQSQSIDTPVPYMRKELKELSETLKQCLSFNPSKRPTAKELCKLSETQLRRIEKHTKPREKKADSQQTAMVVSVNQFWPEEMIES